MKTLIYAATIAVAAGCTTLAPQDASAYGTGVVINGHHLSPAELVALQYRLGITIRPGIYQVDPRSGCWINRSTGQGGCPRRAGRTGGSPADRWVGPEELGRGGLRGVRPGPLSTYDFVR